MSDTWKLNKWIEDITPRRAIQNFFHHATPVDSPDPEELVQFAQQSSTELRQEATPVAGSSQRTNAIKRKLISHQEEMQENASKRHLSEESYMIAEDSISGISEVPSQLASPSSITLIPPMQIVKVNKRISMTAFTQAIQSQPSQSSKHNSKMTSFIDDSSIPSALASPDEALSQRPRKGMSRVSMSAFAETLGRKRQVKVSQASSTAADSSELESSGIPSNLESPDYVTSQRPGVDKIRRRVSSSGFKKILEKSQQPEKEKTVSEDFSLDSLGIPDTFASSVLMPSQELEKEGKKEKIIRSSNRTFTRSSPVSPSSSAAVPRSESDERASQHLEPTIQSELFLVFPAKISSPITILVDEKNASADEIETTLPSSLSSNRSRKSLKLDSPNVKPPATVNEPKPVVDDDEVEETPSSDYKSSDEEVVVMEERNASVTPEQTARHLNESNPSVRSKFSKSRMSSTNRYPAIKNSTVVAEGEPFSGELLSMSPIASEKDAPLQIQSTPPTTSAQPSRIQARSVSQSPMFLNVMQKALQKNTQKMSAAEISTVRRSSVIKKPTTPKDLSAAKSILINPSKGKSLTMPALDGMPESSETEWEDVEEDANVKPLPIKIAFEQIEDRSKQFVPVEQRLRADPVFQAKVKNQRAKLEAQKAAEKAAEAAKKKKTQRKPRSSQAANKDADSVVNKGNFRFYARTKITKEALDAVHNLVGEWFDFTIDQMETFCNDEGKVALETWEDCMRLLKRQGIIKNYWEYSGLCHELLLNDECSGLLPSDFPAGHYESKREAKRQNK